MSNDYECGWCERRYVVPALARSCEDRHDAMADMVLDAPDLLEPRYVRKPLVYVAGPYTHPDPLLNARRAVEVGDEVLRLGGAVIIPHLSLVWQLVSPKSVPEWYALDLDVLAHCDLLVRFDGASTGADAEVEFALDHDIPVVFGLDELRAWFA